MKRKITYYISLFVVCITFGGCTSLAYVMDTSSNSVTEFQEDFYVHRIDSVMELHYNLWSSDASIWMSALNLTKEMLFVVSDSCYLMLDGEKHYFNLTAETEEYLRQLQRVPNVEDYQLGKFFPILPGGWKGFLGPPLPINAKDYQHIQAPTTYTAALSPITIVSQVCFFRQTAAYAPKCIRDTIWVEAITPIDASQLRSLENDKSLNKTDKFYISSTPIYD